MKQLKPEMVWEIFDTIFLHTYHGSGHEPLIREKIKQWVEIHKESGLSVSEDTIGNLLIKKSASKGMEHVSPLILQGHLDMVCETDRPEGFDFEHSPILAQISSDHEWIQADHTTLGADNGIGVSMALALLVENELSLKSGPIEVLLTVGEETGLDGAFGLDPIKLGIMGKHLINIDSEDWGIITIGSAGGGDTTFERTLTWSESVPPKTLQFYQLSISGLFGGHSGVDIHLPRANAIVLIARIMSAVLNGMDVWIANWTGGTKSNAIPRQSVLKFAILSPNKTKLEEIVNQEKSAIEAYYCPSEKQTKFEPNLKIVLTPADYDYILPASDSREILASACSIPHGVLKMSPDIPTLVETSNNFAIVKTEKSKISFVCMARSNVDAELAVIRRNFRRIADIGRWTVIEKPSYPGWKPDPTQSFLQFVSEIYEKHVGNALKIEAIHAGLECGIIGSKIAGMQMISIGPTVKFPHTPGEKLQIASVGQMYQLLTETIIQFAKKHI